jgi:hypothetical protein
MVRGAHKSALEHSDFLREELLDFVQKGFWTVLPYKLLKKRTRRLWMVLALGMLLLGAGVHGLGHGLDIFL